MEPTDTATLSLDVERIQRIFQEAPVTLAVLYGSYARQEARAASDIDLAVEFDESLSSIERTRERLDLIKRLSTSLETDEIDIVPLSQTPPALQQEICEDGLVLYGEPSRLATYCDDLGERDTQTHQDRLAAFDEILTDLEQVV